MTAWLTQVRFLTRQRGFAGFLLTTFCLGVALSFVLPFLSLWGTEARKFTPFQFGMFMAAFSLSGVLLTVFLGRGSDTRFSRKAVLLLGSGCGSIGYAGFAVITQLWLLALIAVTMAAMAAVCFSQIFAIARDWFENERAEQAPVTLSIVRVCFSLAWIVGPTIAALILTWSDFTGLFLATAALYALVFLGALRFVPHRPPPPAKTAEVQAMPVLQTLTRPPVAGNVIALTLFSAAMAATTMSLPLALTRDFAGTPMQVGFAFGVGPFVEVPFMLWFGQLASRGHSPRLMRIGGIIVFCYFALLFSATKVWHVCIIQGMTGIAYAVFGNVAIGSIQNLIPAQPGLASALFANSGSVGKWIGYLFFGLALPGLGARGVFGVCALVAAVVCILVFQLYRPKQAVLADMSTS